MATSLLEKYRPRTLAEVRGQNPVTRALKLYAKNPYPVAMLFHGGSGIGKTAAAHALARDLGCAVGDGGLGGLFEIASGEMNGDAVRQALDALRYRPLLGSGWRVLVCNEADRMSTAAETIWLDGLEHLPRDTTVVFTTNAPERLTQRFRDRCECYAFESDARRLRPALRAFARHVWKQETGQDRCPHLDIIGMPTLGDPDAMFASFRLALRQLERYVREALAPDGADFKKVRHQLNKSIGLDQDNTVECDHCGEVQPVVIGDRKHRCRACKKVFAITW
jgi:hypothetical protein